MWIPDFGVSGLNGGILRILQQISGIFIVVSEK